jgi:hypothetical protein
MKTISRIEKYNASPEEVFRHIDDLGVTGMHMTKSSIMMMGSKLHLNFLTENKTGLGSRYRWSGSMMGLDMNFTVAVTKWVDGKEKTWETVGQTKMIIYSWYRMNLVVRTMESLTEAELSISYEKPCGFINKVLSFLFADWYCRWCLRQMLGDAKEAVEESVTASLGARLAP